VPHFFFSHATTTCHSHETSCHETEIPFDEKKKPPGNPETSRPRATKQTIYGM